MLIVAIISLLLLLLSLWQAALLVGFFVQGSSLQVVAAREQLAGCCDIQINRHVCKL
jgi:hypothetical protein